MKLHLVVFMTAVMVMPAIIPRFLSQKCDHEQAQVNTAMQGKSLQDVDAVFEKVVPVKIEGRDGLCRLFTDTSVSSHLFVCHVVGGVNELLIKRRVNSGE